MWLGNIAFVREIPMHFPEKKVPIKGKGKGGWGAMELGGGVVVAQSNDECITIWMSDDEAQ